MIRRSLAWMALLAILVAGCARNDDGEPAGPTGTVTINTTEPAQTLTPAMASETAGGDIVDAMWTGLLDYDPITAQPRLANAHDINSADNRNWTVRLNRGWEFHDGTPVTAQSYVKAWNWAAQCQNHAANQAFFGPSGANIAGFQDVAGTTGPDGQVTCPDKVRPMRGLKVVNPTTFTIELDSPVSILESILGYWAFSPMPEAFFKNPDGFAAAPVGNGPFRFESRTLGSDVRMSANTDYLGTDKAQVSELDWRVYTDLDTAYADLLAGRLDLLTRMPTSVLPEKRWQTELGEGHYLLKPAGLFTSLTFPLYDQRFAKPELRAALSRAVDRVSIIREVWSDTVTPADSWAPPVVEGYLPGSCGTTCVYDAAAAREILAHAGGFSGTLSIAYNADGGHSAWVAQVCKSITATLGITCTPKPFPSQRDFLDAVSARGMAGLFRTTWRMDYPNVQNFLEPLYSTGGSNEGGFSDAQFDQLMRQAKSLPPPEALSKYAEAQRILSAQVPAVPLWFGTVQMGWSDRIDSHALLITPFATVDLGSVKVVAGATPPPVPSAPPGAPTASASRSGASG